MGFRGLGGGLRIVYLKTMIGRTAWEVRERGEFGRRELASNYVEMKIVRMRVVRDAFEGFLLWGIILRESGEWLLAVVKMAILLGVPVIQSVVLFLQEGGLG